jgi:hypothetical protein
MLDQGYRSSGSNDDSGNQHAKTKQCPNQNLQPVIGH